MGRCPFLLDITASQTKSLGALVYRKRKHQAFYFKIGRPGEDGEGAIGKRMKFPPSVFIFRMRGNLSDEI